MRLKSHRIEGFIRRPDPAMRAILVYGPDDGLARERAARLAEAAVADPDFGCAFTDFGGAPAHILATPCP